MPRAIDRATKSYLSEYVSDNLRCTAYLYKNIRVTLTDDKVHIGWVKCVDPMTGTLILIMLKSINNTFEVEDVIFIQQSYIITIDVLVEIDPEVKSFLLELYTQKVAAVDEDRRDRLVAFIKAHRMPAEVSADGRNISTTGCTIQPPYIDESCMGSNAIVVYSVGKVIKIFDSRYEAKSNEEAANKTSTDEDAELKLGMQNLKLAPAQNDLSAVAISPKEDFQSNCDSSSDESIDIEVGIVKNDFNPASSEESSGTEESYEFISDEISQ